MTCLHLQLTEFDTDFDIIKKCINNVNEIRLRFPVLHGTLSKDPSYSVTLKDFKEFDLRGFISGYKKACGYLKDMEISNSEVKESLLNSLATFTILGDVKEAHQAIIDLGDTLENVVNRQNLLRYMHIDLNRFIKNQDNEVDGYNQACEEIKNGKKVEHWIWYIFPQMDCYGHSWESKYFGIHGRKEAIAYANNSLLRERLENVFQLFLNTGLSVEKVFGNDAIKVRSCAKLFNSVMDSNPIKQFVNKFYCK